ncbi:MAG: ATP-binding protein [Verrucomicrobia bacterium]|nr:ATP-binding protein [Verrucomicrobiota bacterium]
MSSDSPDNPCKIRILTESTQYDRFSLMKTGCSTVLHACPCGYYGDSKHNCRCTPLQIQNYRNKISGPLLDRIDIHIEVPSVRYQELASTGTGEPSAAIRSRVLAARAAQQERFKGPVLSLSKAPALSLSKGKVRCNAGMRTKELHKHCQLKPDAQAQLKMAITELNFSARAYDRILKVARTIADLANSADIQTEHVSEAIQYRNLDRQFWI